MISEIWTSKNSISVSGIGFVYCCFCITFGIFGLNGRDWRPSSGSPIAGFVLSRYRMLRAAIIPSE
jgi:hypothetical protein